MKIYNINQIVNLYFNEKYTITKISKTLEIPFSTIKYQLKKHGYTIIDNTHNGNNRKHNIDKDFFKSIDCRNKAYILGLIISDGYVDNYSKLTFTSKDKELVEIFQRELKSEHKLAKYDVYDKRTDKTYTRYSLQVASKDIVNDLNNLGVFSNKSFTCRLPQIPEELFWHFVRGLFDGDGSISQEKNRKNGALRFKIIGSECLITELKNKLTEYGLSTTKLSYSKYKSEEGKIISLLYYSYKDLFLIKNKIYENSDNLKLSRKYEIFQTLKNNVKN